MITHRCESIEDPFAGEICQCEPEPDWIEVAVRVPHGSDLAPLWSAISALGFRDVDWCVLERDGDLGRVEYHPTPPITAAYAKGVPE